MNDFVFIVTSVQLKLKLLSAKYLFPQNETALNGEQVYYSMRKSGIVSGCG